MQTLTRSSTARAALFGLALTLTAGCGGDDDDSPADDGGDDTTDDGGGVDAGTEVDAGAGGAVLLAERVFSPEGRLYYLSVLPEVPTGPVDRSKALELSSADIEVFGEKVYVRDRQANTITRYAVGGDLTLVEDGQVSFAGVALGTSRYHSAYVSPDRAFLLDHDEWRIIEWNPTTMELTGEVAEVDHMDKPELPFGAFGPAARTGDRVVSPMYWTDFDNLVLYPGSGAALIDPASAEEPVLLEDARVGGAYRAVLDDSGDVYVIGVVGGDLHLFGSASGGGALPTSGILRIAAGADQFDPTYLVDVEAITGSVGVWSIHRIDDTTVLAQIYDPEAPEPADVDAYNDSADFIYVLIDSAAGTFEPVAGLPRGGRANAGDHVVDDRLYIQLGRETGEDQFETVVHAVSGGPETTIEEAFTVPSGDVWHLQRIR